jgi:hypothetical protein
MKIKRLLMAADVVETVDPNDFDMSNAKKCILGHCAMTKLEEFKELWPLNGKSSENCCLWDTFAVACFGVQYDQASYLFGIEDGNHKMEPVEAAAKLRGFVADHKKRLARKKAARARKKAELIHRAERIRMSTDAGMAALNAAVEDAMGKFPKVKEPV